MLDRAGKFIGCEVEFEVGSEKKKLQGFRGAKQVLLPSSDPLRNRISSRSEPRCWKIRNKESRGKHSVAACLLFSLCSIEYGLQNDTLVLTDSIL